RGTGPKLHRCTGDGTAETSRREGGAARISPAPRAVAPTATRALARPLQRDPETPDSVVAQGVRRPAPRGPLHDRRPREKRAGGGVPARTGSSRQQSWL